MAIRYVRFEGVRVSKKWYVVLKRARAAGHHSFKVNSGKRTMREQWALFRQNMRFNGRRWVQRPNHPLTAYPTPTAPHVRIGRADHALDLNNPQDLVIFLESPPRNSHPSFPVFGESWHLELPGKELTRLWKKYRD